jgi:peptide-methionine (R)-S-oxide reductase
MADSDETTEDEWRKKLTPEQFHVLRERATEAPFTGKLLYNDEAGSYVCAACSNVLFDSSTKFDADCGWPNFYDARKGAVVLTPDDSHGMHRIAVTCAQCGGHLGHVFDDVPDQPTGQRYCINSAALDFKKDS